MKVIDRTDAAPWRTLAIACGIFLTAGVILAGLGPALPQLAAHVGRDIAALGWLFTAISAGVIVAQFGIGPASDRFGQRPVLIAGMLLMSCGTFGVTIGGSLASLIASALLAGFGFGGVLTAGNGLVAALFPTRSATALNGVNVFFGIGSMIGPMVAGAAGAQLGMSQAALWVGAGLLLALAPVLVGATKQAATQRNPIDAAAHAAPPRVAFLLFGVLLLVYVGTEIGFGAWVTVYMIRSAGFLPTTAALVASGFWLAFTLGRVVGTMLGLRMRPAALLLLGLLGLLSGAALLIFSVGHVAGSIAGVLMLGLSCGPVFPTGLAIVTSAARESGTVSLVLAIANCGGLIIPAVIGVLLSSYGPTAVAGLMLGTTTTLIVLFAVIMRMGFGKPRLRAEPAG